MSVLFQRLMRPKYYSFEQAYCTWKQNNCVFVTYVTERNSHVFSKPLKPLQFLRVRTNTLHLNRNNHVYFWRLKTENGNRFSPRTLNQYRQTTVIALDIKWRVLHVRLRRENFCGFAPQQLRLSGQAAIS